MSRRSRSRSSAAPLLTRYPLTADVAVAIARAAADDQPALVVLVLDATGASLAVRPHDLAPSDVEDACRTLLGLWGLDGVGPSVIVSVDAGFGCEPEPAVAVWPDVQRAFTEAGGTLLDWLLVCGDRVRSVSATASGPAGWAL
ncbi:MAG: hypothetical protein M3394_10650 [Actinomycetota bacterium]|nr:hypothetical protein [Actinomycetota bacterium]